MMIGQSGPVLSLTKDGQALRHIPPRAVGHFDIRLKPSPAWCDDTAEGKRHVHPGLLNARALRLDLVALRMVEPLALGLKTFDARAARSVFRSLEAAI
ncbi:hypothetical protein EMQ25_11685 [Arsenicitalea aurantiaca]|uniref:Uncharacterized protein n=1 Tax=Arsenicitalea aurantiaca TaxID=1783274 RepID=A0A433X7C2_9HYPH|nr:hypothetical protein [Arsenicitalea aurantiaca]RUT29991.1 hypothetical protein EMQ25_11685 [Arsenicitalea aurantiaca]